MKNARVDVDPVQHIEVVAAVGFADVTKRGREVEAAAVRADVIPRERGVARVPYCIMRRPRTFS